MTNIISASRRTDLPALFPEQTIRTIMKMHYETPVDAVVFWTKNAEPILPYLDILTEARIPFYFQYTVNGYDKTWEPGVPELADKIKTFQALAKLIGKDRVIWRYDPIFIAENWFIYEHLLQLNKISMALKDSTQKLVFSFFDPYPKLGATPIRPPNEDEQQAVFNHIKQLGVYYNWEVATCAELIGSHGIIKPNRCIDPVLLKNLGVKMDHIQKDYSQRKTCGCIKSTDIGTYHTCTHGCRYCYAR